MQSPSPGAGEGASRVSLGGVDTDAHSDPACDSQPVKAADWRTQVDPELTAAFGCPEVHFVAFQQSDDAGGPRTSVILQIPGVSRQVVNKALRVARDQLTRVAAACDTRAQADAFVERATRLLPHHRRISFERAGAGQWGTLA
jgi:hypothetical protein